MCCREEVITLLADEEDLAYAVSGHAAIAGLDPNNLALVVPDNAAMPGTDPDMAGFFNRCLPHEDSELFIPMRSATGVCDFSRGETEGAGKHPVCNSTSCAWPTCLRTHSYSRGQRPNGAGRGDYASPSSPQSPGLML